MNKKYSENIDKKDFGLLLDYNELEELNDNIQFDCNDKTGNEFSDSSFFKDIPNLSKETQNNPKSKSHLQKEDFHKEQEEGIEIIKITSPKPSPTKTSKNSTINLNNFSSYKEDTNAFINTKIRETIRKELGVIEFLMEKDLDILVTSFRKNGLRSYKEACAQGFLYDFDTKILRKISDIIEPKFTFEGYSSMKNAFQKDLLEKGNMKIRNDIPLSKTNRKIN